MVFVVIHTCVEIVNIITKINFAICGHLQMGNIFRIVLGEGEVK